jgi:hypothetical protein
MLGKKLTKKAPIEAESLARPACRPPKLKFGDIRAVLDYRLSPLWLTGAFYGQRQRIGRDQHDNLQRLAMRDVRQSTAAAASSEQLMRLLMLRHLTVVLLRLVGHSQPTWGPARRAIMETSASPAISRSYLRLRKPLVFRRRRRAQSSISAPEASSSHKIATRNRAASTRP